MKGWLIDTGPLVAYLDRSDPAHGSVAARLDTFRGELFTTSAVITETMHFVSSSPTGAALLAEFVHASGLTIFDGTQPAVLQEAVALMEKYADTPMDFADATLVLLAERLKTYEILTLDRRGFTAYRTRDRMPLVQVLDRDQ